MPLGAKPICWNCKVDSTEIWHRKDESILCKECFQNSKPLTPDTDILKNSTPALVPNKHDIKTEDTSKEDNIAPEKEGENGSVATKKSEETEAQVASRQSTRPGRGRPPKSRNGVGGKLTIAKGKSRRSIFKRNVFKAPAATPTIVTCESVFYKGSYFQIGDIVSLMDEGGDIFYAQIRGMLQDQYAQKSAAITWLIPTQSAFPPKAGFDPDTYILGPEEELVRSLDFLEFVMHCPSDHFRFRNELIPAQVKSFTWVRKEAAMKH